METMVPNIARCGRRYSIRTLWSCLKLRHVADNSTAKKHLLPLRATFILIHVFFTLFLCVRFGGT